MLNLLFYEPEAETPTGREALTEACRIVGIAFEAPAEAAYRPGRWHDPVTGAQAVIDLGIPDLTGDEDPHPPTTYSGWRALPLSVQIPLVGPHWHAVEALTMVERLTAALPGVVPLDTEDTRGDDDGDSGPYPWSRPRRIAHWEVLRTAQDLVVPRLNRGSSLRLWRWRRERAAAAITHANLHWPEITVLLDRETGAARTSALIPLGQATALPVVDLLVLQHPGGVGCLAFEDLVALTGDLDPLPAGARRLPLTDDLQTALRNLPLLPVRRFATLLDEDWQD